MKSSGTTIPKHIAFIMDGNGRWAKKRLMPRSYGHKVGVETLRKTAVAVFDLGIEYMTVYTLSTENTLRPKEELDGLMDLIRTRLEDMLAEIIERGVKVNFLGDLTYFPSDIRDLLDRVQQKSAAGKFGTLNLALNYGARAEIVRAAKTLGASGKPITEETFREALYTAGQPDPDLIVRTGGEKRLSNFLLFQAAYAEFVFTDTLWPDFDAAALRAVLTEYANRNRRYGKV